MGRRRSINIESPPLAKKLTSDMPLPGRRRDNEWGRGERPSWVSGQARVPKEHAY